MPSYWRDPDTNSVFQYRGEPDDYEVVVIPVEKWRRLVWLLAHNPDVTPSDILEVEAIIAEADHG
jgi:hypothetical protein